MGLSCCTGRYSRVWDQSENLPNKTIFDVDDVDDGDGDDGSCSSFTLTDTNGKDSSSLDSGGDKSSGEKEKVEIIPMVEIESSSFFVDVSRSWIEMIDDESNLKDRIKKTIEAECGRKLFVGALGLDFDRPSSSSSSQTSHSSSVNKRTVGGGGSRLSSCLSSSTSRDRDGDEDDSGDEDVLLEGEDWINHMNRQMERGNHFDESVTDDNDLTDCDDDDHDDDDDQSRPLLPQNPFFSSSSSSSSFSSPNDRFDQVGEGKGESLRHEAKVAMRVQLLAQGLSNKYGPIESIKINRRQSYCFVVFKEPSSLQKAVCSLRSSKTRSSLCSSLSQCLLPDGSPFSPSLMTDLRRLLPPSSLPSSPSSSCSSRVLSDDERLKEMIKEACPGPQFYSRVPKDDLRQQAKARSEKTKQRRKQFKKQQQLLKRSSTKNNSANSTSSSSSSQSQSSSSSSSQSWERNSSQATKMGDHQNQNQDQDQGKKTEAPRRSYCAVTRTNVRNKPRNKTRS